MSSVFIHLFGKQQSKTTATSLPSVPSVIMKNAKHNVICSPKSSNVFVVVKCFDRNTKTALQNAENELEITFIQLTNLCVQGKSESLNRNT